MEHLDTNPPAEKPFDIAITDPNEAFDGFYLANLPFTRMVAANNYSTDPAATAQEVMIKAWQQSDLDFNDRGRAWLRTVTKRQVVDEWRARRARPQTVETTPEMLEESMAASGTGGLERVLQRRLIEQLRSHLNAEQFDVLAARYLDDMDTKQVADKLGVPKGTVQSRNYYALRAARKILESMGADSNTVFGN